MNIISTGIISKLMKLKLNAWDLSWLSRAFKAKWQHSAICLSTITNRLANTILTGWRYSVLVKEVIKASVHKNLINTIFESRNFICAYYLRSSHRPESRSLYTVDLIILLRCMGNQHSANITTKQKTVFATSRRCVKNILHII